jgi:hypothetical protein
MYYEKTVLPFSAAFVIRLLGSGFVAEQAI